MKSIDEIAKTSNLIIHKNTEAGGSGLIVYGSLKNCSVMWGRKEGGLYDHVSISPTNRIPTWNELCKVKDMFFKDDEECYLVFPKKEQYVNLDKYCMHIWRDASEDIHPEKQIPGQLNIEEYLGINGYAL